MFHETTVTSTHLIKSVQTLRITKYIKISIGSRLVHFAKFREMQKMILQKMFREKWVRKIAKMNTTFRV